MQETEGVFAQVVHKLREEVDQITYRSHVDLSLRVMFYFMLFSDIAFVTGTK